MVYLEKTQSQAFEMLHQVYGNNTKPFTCVLKGKKRFKEGYEFAKDDFRSERPSTSKIEINVKWVRQAVSG